MFKLRLTLSALLMLPAMTCSNVTNGTELTGAVSDNPPGVTRPSDYGKLPGRVIGILANDISEALQAEGRSAPDNVLGFAVGRHSYRWVYLPETDSNGESIFVPVGPTGAERRKFESVQLATTKAEGANVTKDQYRLVEVEVNGGLGSPDTDRFVATELKPIHDSSQVSLNVMESVRDARRRFAEVAEGKQAVYEKKLIELKQNALKDAAAENEIKSETGEFVTWLPKSARLLVRLERRVTSGLYRTAAGASLGVQQASDVTPPQTEGIRYGIEFGIIDTVEFQYDRSGKFLQAKDQPLRTFVTKLQLPK